MDDVVNDEADPSEDAKEPASQRRVNAAARLLVDQPEDAVRVFERCKDAELSSLGEAIKQIQRLRALARGDLDEIVDAAFEVGFGDDDLSVMPWRQGNVIVCPGGIINKSRNSHRCRFVSVDGTWIWDSIELIREDKRDFPGPVDGFRAIGLLPVVNGLTLDVVSGRARSGQHSVDRVVSFAVKQGDLVEVSQRNVGAAGMK